MSDINNFGSGFDSRDSEILIFDGPGDTTVRPARDSLRKFLEAERERIARWRHLQNNPPDSKEQPEAGTGE